MQGREVPEIESHGAVRFTFDALFSFLPSFVALCFIFSPPVLGT